MMIINSRIAHIEDAIINSGACGLDNIIDILRAIINGHGDYNVTVKWDGAPAIIFGIDKTDNRFFLSTKSIKSKTFKSIIAIRADPHMSDSLKFKLCKTFDALKSYNGKSIVQADLMYTDDSIYKELIDGINHYIFQANTLIYGIPTTDAEAIKIANSSIGIVVHTCYSGEISSMKPRFDQTFDASTLSNDIYIINHKHHLINIYSSQLNSRLSHIIELASLCDRHMLDRFARIQLELCSICYKASFKAYYNKSLIKETQNNINLASYIDFVRKQISERKLKLRLTSAKDKLINIQARACRGIPPESFDRIILLYRAIVDLKKELLDRLSIDTAVKPYKRVNNKLVKTAHEGLVISKADTIYKLIDRAEFSRENFINVKPWGNAAVITYGRFNPPTLGHKKLIDKAATIASGAGAKLIIYVSSTHDSNRNPLPIGLKMKYIKQMFKQYKNSIVPVTGSILPLLSRLYTDGYKRLTLVLGDDRIDSIGSLARRYNGKKNSHGYYNFSNINIINAGLRTDNDSINSVSDISASKARSYAYARDYKNFIKCMPKYFANKLKLYHDIIAEKKI